MADCCCCSLLLLLLFDENFFLKNATKIFFFFSLSSFSVSDSSFCCVDVVVEVSSPLFKSPLCDRFIGCCGSTNNDDEPASCDVCAPCTPLFCLLPNRCGEEATVIEEEEAGFGNGDAGVGRMIGVVCVVDDVDDDVLFSA